MQTLRFIYLDFFQLAQEVETDDFRQYTQPRTSLSTPIFRPNIILRYNLADTPHFQVAEPSFEGLKCLSHLSIQPCDAILLALEGRTKTLFDIVFLLKTHRPPRHKHDYP